MRGSIAGDLRGAMRELLAAADREYVVLGWPTVPGHRPLVDAAACSCERPDCPEPGAHPISPRWRDEATADPETVVARRHRGPDANILLATGLGVDVLDAPAPVGARVLDDLEREAGRQLAPVAVWGDRYLFLVESPRVGAGGPDDEGRPGVPGGPIPRPDPSVVLWHAAGSYVPLPPSMTPGGRMFWLRAPADGPQSDPLVLVEALVAACARLCGPDEGRS